MRRLFSVKNTNIKYIYAKRFAIWLPLWYTGSAKNITAMISFMEKRKMNVFHKVLSILETDMKEPTPFGWFHLLWIFLGVAAIVLLYTQRHRAGEKQLKWVLGIYGVFALTTELLKQLSWSLDVGASGALIWDYSWYSAPFQLCSTPIYVSLICLFLKKGKLRDHLLAYLSYITILGGLMAMVMPSSCLVDDILVNIHTMWLHCGSLVIGVYLLMSKFVPTTVKALLKGGVTFFCTAGMALIMNVAVYESGILGDETFNMFYISPYFDSELPVFNVIQDMVPYPLFLVTYLVALVLGGGIVLAVSKGIQYGIKYVNNGRKSPVHN